MFRIVRLGNKIAFFSLAISIILGVVISFSAVHGLDSFRQASLQRIERYAPQAITVDYLSDNQRCSAQYGRTGKFNNGRWHVYWPADGDRFKGAICKSGVRAKGRSKNKNFRRCTIEIGKQEYSGFVITQNNRSNCFRL